MKRLIIPYFLFLIFFPAFIIAQEQIELTVLLKKQPPGKERVTTLQSLASYYIFKPKEEAADLNKASTYLKESLDISKRFNYPEGIGGAYILYYGLYREKGEADKSMEYANSAFTVLSRAKLYEQLGEAYLAVCKNLWTTDRENHLKEALLKKAVSAFKKANAKQKTALTLKSLGEHLFYSGKSEEGLARLKESSDLYKYFNYTDLISLYNSVSGAYTDLGNHKEGLRFALSAVKIAEQHKDTTSLVAIIYNRIGYAYAAVSDHKNAANNFRKGIVIAKKNKDTVGVFQLSNNLAGQLKNQEKFKEALKVLDDLYKGYTTEDYHVELKVRCLYMSIYFDMDNLDMAEKYCNEILDEAHTKNVNEETLHYIYKYVVRIAFYRKDYKKAQYYLDKCKVHEWDHTLKEKSIFYLLQSQLDSVQGNYKAAYSNFKLYKETNDSLYDNTKSKQIAELQVKYATEKKEQDIKLLSKERELEKQKAIHARRSMFIAIGITGLIMIIAILLYMAYRNKNKVNRILRYKQTEISEKNNVLNRLVDEKEWLLKEIHHRVKNNLQIVMSLLNSQSTYLKDNGAKSAIRDSQRRVHSMSLLHKKLYQSETLSSVAMPAYIHELVAYLKDSFDAGYINFKVKLDEVNFEINQAVPIGLLLNEAITNSIKYAFPDTLKQCVIKITLQEKDNNQFELMIIDNGVGISNDFDTNNPKTLGMSLMQGLTGDLNGSFEIYNDNGTVIKINFNRQKGQKYN
ncbi:histidine kinase dimerization/phosphoacceptor domain -containing protein [Flavobacterium hauense]